MATGAGPGAMPRRDRAGQADGWLATSARISRAAATRLSRESRISGQLHGERMTVDAGSGEILDVYRTADKPTGFLLTACGNRRASVCPACSETYRDDTFHLILSGLRGGKGVPEEVSAHPRVFATFTAPSFGAVAFGDRPHHDGGVQDVVVQREFPGGDLPHARVRQPAPGVAAQPGRDVAQVLGGDAVRPVTFDRPLQLGVRFLARIAADGGGRWPLFSAERADFPP
jgi:hypothetical protein